MNETQLRAAFLLNPDRYRSVVLTDNQISIIELIGGSDYPTMSAREYADEQGISVQSSSQQLSRLWLRGYLGREERLDPTGGVIYRYKPV